MRRVQATLERDELWCVLTFTSVLYVRVFYRAAVAPESFTPYPQQAPVKVKTAVGKMLDYYLKMEPHLFTPAIDKQLEQLKEEREEKERLAKESPPSSQDKSELVLYRYVLQPAPDLAPICPQLLLAQTLQEQHSKRSPLPTGACLKYEAGRRGLH